MAATVALFLATGTLDPPIWSVIKAVHTEFESIEFVYEGVHGELDAKGQVWKTDPLPLQKYTGRAKYLPSGAIWFQRVLDAPESGGYTETNFIAPGADLKRTTKAGNLPAPDQSIVAGGFIHAYDMECFAHYWLLPFLMAAPSALLDSAVHEGHEIIDGLKCEIVKFPPIRQRGWFCVERNGCPLRWESYGDESCNTLHTRMSKVTLLPLALGQGKTYWTVGAATVDFHRRNANGKWIFDIHPPTYRYEYKVAIDTVKINSGLKLVDLELKFNARYGVSDYKTNKPYVAPNQAELPRSRVVSSAEIKDAVEAASQQASELTAPAGRGVWLSASTLFAAVGVSALVGAAFVAGRQIRTP